MECFASPLNCRYAPFCSAFADTDRPFGSVGSFFSFRPTAGSFEANPPFEPGIFDAAVRHIESLLGNPQAGPLSFVVVSPRRGFAALRRPRPLHAVPLSLAARHCLERSESLRD